MFKYFIFFSAAFFSNTSAVIYLPFAFLFVTDLVASRNDHELISDHSRMRQTVANAIDERRMLGGDAFAEHFIR